MLTPAVPDRARNFKWLLGAYVAEYSQLLLVVSTHMFFLSVHVVEIRAFFLQCAAIK
jgi:hypothetical protein